MNIKTYVFLLLTILFLIPITEIKAQTLEDKPSVVCVNVANSLVNKIFDLTDISVDNYSIEVDATPAFQLTYDRMENNWLSVGVGLSAQMMNLHYTDYEYEDENGQTQVIDFDVDVLRANGGLRALANYGTETLKMYSGFRLGVTMWNVDVSSTVPNFSVEEDFTVLENSFVVAPQIVIFGARYYFAKNIGLNIELALGAPHYLSGGICVKIP